MAKQLKRWKRKITRARNYFRDWFASDDDEDDYSGASALTRREKRRLRKKRLK